MAVTVSLTRLYGQQTADYMALGRKMSLSNLVERAQSSAWVAKLLINQILSPYPLPSDRQTLRFEVSIGPAATSRLTPVTC